MAKIVGRHHHHKHYRLRRAIRERSGGGQPITSLQLPTFNFSPLPGVPRTIYPQGWVFKRSPPSDTGGLLYAGVFLLLIVACIALAKLFGG